MLDIAGYTNILSKIVGTNNKLNNVLATIKALSSFKQGKFSKAKKTPVVSETPQDEEAPKVKKAKKAVEATPTEA